jgi:hypothetical protein
MNSILIVSLTNVGIAFVGGPTFLPPTRRSRELNKLREIEWAEPTI